MKKTMIMVLALAFLISANFAFAAPWNKKAKDEKNSADTVKAVKCEKKADWNMTLVKDKHNHDEKTTVVKVDHKPADASSDKPAAFSKAKDSVTKVCDSAGSFVRQCVGCTIITGKRVISKTREIGEGVWGRITSKFQKSPKQD